MVAKYIVSEKEKFGREIDQATAEAEVDEWLLKQATYAPTKTTNTDLVLAAGALLRHLRDGHLLCQPGVRKRQNRSGTDGVLGKVPPLPPRAAPASAVCVLSVRVVLHVSSLGF